jgi:hypothetical protein
MKQHPLNRVRDRHVAYQLLAMTLVVVKNPANDIVGGACVF